LINTLLGKVSAPGTSARLSACFLRVEAINRLEAEIKKLSDDLLRAKTEEFRARIQERVKYIADEPDADPDRRKQIDEERNQAIKEVS